MRERVGLGEQGTVQPLLPLLSSLLSCFLTCFLAERLDGLHARRELLHPRLRGRQCGGSSARLVALRRLRRLLHRLLRLLLRLLELGSHVLDALVAHHEGAEHDLELLVAPALAVEGLVP